MLSSQRAVLIIDGHYMYKTHTYDKKQRKVDAYKLIKHIEKRLESEGVSLGRRYFFDVSKSSKKLAFHKTLQNMHVQVVLNDTKEQSINCVNKNCEYNKKPFQKTVQAGVDVAIVTKALTLVADDQIDILVLVAGDGDFADALKWIAEVKHKKIWIIGHNASLSIKLKEIATPSMLSYLDKMDVWMDNTITGNNPNPLPNQNPGNNHQQYKPRQHNPPPIQSNQNLPAHVYNHLPNQLNPPHIHSNQNPFQNPPFNQPIPKPIQVPQQHNYQPNQYNQPVIHNQNNQFNPSYNQQNPQNQHNPPHIQQPQFPPTYPQQPIIKPSQLPPQHGYQLNQYNQPNSNNQYPYPIVNLSGGTFDNNPFKPNELNKPLNPKVPQLDKNMNLLMEMGFTNYQRNLNALNKSNNNFDLAIEYLMDKE